MTSRIWVILALMVGALLACNYASPPVQGCCPAPRSGQRVVNADQTVILIWDAATKTEHFIRQASFKSEADDFGFLIPSPNQPELDESGNEAFNYFQKLTEPEVKKINRPSSGLGCGCGADAGRKDKAASPPQVRSWNKSWLQVSMRLYLKQNRPRLSWIGSRPMAMPIHLKSKSGPSRTSRPAGRLPHLRSPRARNKKRTRM